MRTKALKPVALSGSKKRRAQVESDKEGEEVRWARCAGAGAMGPCGIWSGDSGGDR